MRKYITSYRIKSVIVLFCLSLMFSGCSAEEKDFSETPSAEESDSDVDQETESISTEDLSVEEPAEDVPEAVITEVNWEECFEGINGAAVVYSPFENSYQIYNPELADTQRSPCSTFKIISSLIALEDGLLVPEDSTRTCSSEVFWNENWNKDINFEDAFRNSCVWYYREVINEIGSDVMQEELNRLCYGNCDISDWEGRMNTNNNNRALTGFWIESSLKISPKEQVEVMERIFGEDSIYSQETKNHLKQVMLVSGQDSADAFIYGKTGMGKAHGIVVDAWFTGFADTVNGRKYFCIYLGETDGKDVSSTKAKEIAIEIVSNLETE